MPPEVSDTLPCSRNLCFWCDCVQKKEKEKEKPWFVAEERHVLGILCHQIQFLQLVFLEFSKQTGFLLVF